jgi:hypothetical protein
MVVVPRSSLVTNLEVFNTNFLKRVWIATWISSSFLQDTMDEDIHHASMLPSLGDVGMCKLFSKSYLGVLCKDFLICFACFCSF